MAEHKLINANIVGTWDLQAIYFKFEDGTKMDMYGPNPNGVLMYDNCGMMNAQLGCNNHKSFFERNDNLDERIPSAQLFGSYMAYYGKYYEEISGKLIHEVIGCINPEWIGEKEIRYFKIKDDCLKIWTPVQSIHNKEATIEVIWHRKG